ncbi:hypothetical protein Slin15195_G105990 [Septoria linicola]|uniref:Uncharacterized protein n=1 Tax=Septoria linicola TaxID=215465 RepID=A0A9Q9B327_9PEZI|nr:hypothetical protein Slin15195_G105990 [Septoria linicola]
MEVDTPTCVSASNMDSAFFYQDLSRAVTRLCDAEITIREKQVELQLELNGADDPVHDDLDNELRTIDLARSDLGLYFASGYNRFRTDRPGDDPLDWQNWKEIAALNSTMAVLFREDEKWQAPEELDELDREYQQILADCEPRDLGPGLPPTSPSFDFTANAAEPGFPIALTPSNLADPAPHTRLDHYSTIIFSPAYQSWIELRCPACSGGNYSSATSNPFRGVLTFKKHLSLSHRMPRLSAAGVVEYCLHRYVSQDQVDALLTLGDKALGMMDKVCAQTQPDEEDDGFWTLGEQEKNSVLGWECIVQDEQGTHHELACPVVGCGGANAPKRGKSFFRGLVGLHDHIRASHPAAHKLETLKEMFFVTRWRC